MKDEKYISKLENAIKQMLTPLKDIPFNLVIESLTGKKVIPFDFSDSIDKELLDVLKNVALRAGRKINKVGITRARANEVGNDIEAFVKSAMQDLNLNPDIPTCASGRKKAMGYLQILFSVIAIDLIIWSVKRIILRILEQANEVFIFPLLRISKLSMILTTLLFLMRCMLQVEKAIKTFTSASIGSCFQ